MPRLQAGVTLMELLVVMSVVTLLLFLGVPSFRMTVERNRDALAANELIGLMQFARTTAISAFGDALLCAREDGADRCMDSAEWGDADLMVALDADRDGKPDEVRRIYSPLRGITHVASEAVFRFDPNGAATSGRIGYCIDTERLSREVVRLFATGRAEIGGRTLFCAGDNE
jgi:type IV fimbrial biogenesis protein FimT